MSTFHFVLSFLAVLTKGIESSVKILLTEIFLLKRMK